MICERACYVSLHDQMIYFSSGSFFYLVHNNGRFCTQFKMNPHFTVLTFCYVVFFRFGLSNRFDTEFPSILTGKVQSPFSFLALQGCRLLSVHFQVGRIKQLKATVILLFFWAFNSPNFPKPAHSNLSKRFWFDGDAFQLTCHST